MRGEGVFAAAEKSEQRPQPNADESMPNADSPTSGLITGDTRGFTNTFAKDILTTEPKVLQAFDLLAAKINHHLDFPEILVEKGVQGAATLDLYFDHEGNVNEDKSRFSGDHRAIRGLLVRAARKGLLQWYLADAVHLRKDQFRDQHFRAEFLLTHIEQAASRMDKITPGSYTLLRRYRLHDCAQPTGVDLTCLAMKAVGKTKEMTSAKYRGQVQALEDQLDHFDEIELRGIGLEIGRA